MKINALQIDQASLATVIQQTTSGASLSGNLVAYAQASGFMGPTVVWTTGGAQLVSGVKTFADSPIVPYSGSSGSAPSARWVNDQIGAYSGWANNTYTSGAAVSSASGQLATNLALTGSDLYTLIVNQSGQSSTDYATKTALFATGASLSKVHVTGGLTIQDAHFSGYGGTQVFTSGGIILISGGAGGGGGGSNVLVTGSSTIASANITGAGNVTVSYDGTYVIVSGAASAAGVPNTVTTTGTYILAGGYTFSGSPLVPIPTQPSGAANILFISGVSGVLSARDVTVSGILYGQMTGISGGITAGSTIATTYYITGTGVVTASSNASGNITNTFNITSGTTNVVSSGTVTNNFNVTGGTVNNNFNLSGITGNFVNMAFWFDATTLATGLNNAEAMIGRSFIFTGYGIGVINTGTQGYFSGSLYQRTNTNTKTNFVDFSLNSGVVFKASGGYNQTVSGLNRVGLDIYLIGTGITGLSIGVFGVGY